MNKYENTYIVKNFWHPTESDKVEMAKFWGDEIALYYKFIKKYETNNGNK